MADNNRTQTSTQIRNLYSEGVSYMNIKFFNTNLCFQLYPFMSKDNTGRSNYDMKNGISTTVNFEGAFLLMKTADDIINGKIISTNVNIPCAGGASISLNCQRGLNGVPEVVFGISKNNINIPFKFAVVSRNDQKSDGSNEVSYIQTGLGAFNETVRAYLNGINADRHLDKLTEDYVKSITGNQQEQQNQQAQQPSYQQQNYKQNNYNSNNKNYSNSYKKPYNSYKKPYNGSNNGNNWQPPQQQNFDSYEIKN